MSDLSIGDVVRIDCQNSPSLHGAFGSIVGFCEILNDDIHSWIVSLDTPVSYAGVDSVRAVVLPWYFLKKENTFLQFL